MERAKTLRFKNPAAWVNKLLRETMLDLQEVAEPEVITERLRVSTRKDALPFWIEKGKRFKLIISIEKDLIPFVIERAKTLKFKNPAAWINKVLRDIMLDLQEKAKLAKLEGVEE